MQCAVAGVGLPGGACERRTGIARCTASRPPAWSLSAWLAIARSSVRTPSARNAGTTARSPASYPEWMAGPMSNNTACEDVRTSTDKPCPTSSTSMRKAPCAGNAREGQSNGNHSKVASDFPGTPRGSSSHIAPIDARGNAIQRASGIQR